MLHHAGDSLQVLTFVACYGVAQPSSRVLAEVVTSDVAFGSKAGWAEQQARADGGVTPAVQQQVRVEKPEVQALLPAHSLMSYTHILHEVKVMEWQSE